MESFRKSTVACDITGSFTTLFFWEGWFGSQTLLGWLQAWLREILWFASYKRSNISIINLLCDINNKRQRTIAIFLWTSAKTFIADNLNYWIDFSWSPWALQKQLTLSRPLSAAVPFAQRWWSGRSTDERENLKNDCIGFVESFHTEENLPLA